MTDTEKPDTSKWLQPKEIEKQLGISRTSVSRLIERLKREHGEGAVRNVGLGTHNAYNVVNPEFIQKLKEQRGAQ